MEDFQDLKGCLIKIVFMEAMELRTLRGDLLTADTDFVAVQTLNKIVYINRKDIIKISKDLEGRQYD